jgi:hypothetical protein
MSSPLIGAIGLWTLTSPYTIQYINYTVTKLNLITSLVANGVDVYNSYYVPAGISKDVYQNDFNSNQSIVTLESENGPTVNVPSSFISLAPVEPAVPYSHVVISVDLGDLPDSVVLDNLLNDLKTTADGNIGVSSICNIHTLVSSRMYSHSDSILAEEERIATQSSYQSFYTGKVNADAELALAKDKLTQYNDIIISLKNQNDTLKAQVVALTPP